MCRADQLLQCLKLLLLFVELLLLSVDEALLYLKLFCLLFDFESLRLYLLGLVLELCLLRSDLRLLFVDGVDQHGADLGVLDAFNLALRIAEGQKWFDSLDLFGGEADVCAAAVFPGEGDWA